MVPCALPAIVLGLHLRAEPSQQAFEEAQAHYAAGRFERASEALARAYEQDPNPDLLFARAQAERRAGHCETAIELYRAFLAHTPHPNQQEETRARIHDCELALAEASKPSVAAPGSVPTNAPTFAEGPPERKVRLDPWGGALVALGTAGLAVGSGLYGYAVVEQKRADRADSEGEYGTHIERATAFGAAGITLLSVSSVVVVAGVIRYALLAARTRDRRRRTALIPMIAPVVMGLTWTTRF